MPTLISRLFSTGEFTLHNGTYFDEITQTTISQNQANVMAAEFDEVTLGGVVGGLAKREWSNGNLSVGGFFNETPNEIIFTTPGTYTFEAPQGIDKITVLAIGGGGNGDSFYGPGGGGGALAYGNDIPVTPGQSYTVVVGGPSQDSTFSFGANTYISAGGGVSGFNNLGDQNFCGGGGGAGGYTANGGDSGTSINAIEQIPGGAGGVASGTLLTAGFSGGNGGETSFGFDGYNAGPSVTGGGGGGGSGGMDNGGAGGGVGLFGLGANGTPGAATIMFENGWAGTGGSGGLPTTSTQTASAETALFGGGGGGGVPGTVTTGASGAVRIIWSYRGTTRAFPSTNVGILDE